MERADDRALWHGTLMEQLELLAAVQHNCECRYDAMHQRVARCAGHSMLALDQRALNGLLWNRRLAGRLRMEEGADS